VANGGRFSRDPILDALEERVTTANQDLQGAVARFDAARADARVALADYYPNVDASGSATRNRISQTVLNAYGEVEDNLASLHHLADEALTQEAAVTAAAESTRRAQDLYKGGLQSYFSVVEAQNIELASRLSDADIRTRRMTASVLLIKALNGGWQRDELNMGSAESATTQRRARR
jgi:outer membrane protein TolC